MNDTPYRMRRAVKTWFEKHVTGTPEANARLDAAQEALESYTSPVEDDTFNDLNDAVIEAQKDVPWPRRGGWI
jgi:hypothetical protein